VTAGVPVPTARVSIRDRCERPERRGAKTTVALGIPWTVTFNRWFASRRTKTLHLGFGIIPNGLERFPQTDEQVSLPCGAPNPKSTCTSSPGRASMRQTRWGSSRLKLANKTLYRLIGIAEAVSLYRILVDALGTQSQLNLGRNYLGQRLAVTPAPGSNAGDRNGWV
jgi:hypothetical protein